MKTIKVVPYDPMWKTEFERAERFYSHLLEGLEVVIEHVGSTSVVGLWAKPILDIDLIVKDQVASKAVIERLESVGYQHVGNLGVEGREVMKPVQLTEEIDWMTHHLYVCLESSEHVLNHLLLRKHLRSNKEAVVAYSDKKRKLAKAHPHDINAYIDGKTELVIDILRKEGMDETAIQKIMGINKLK